MINPPQGETPPYYIIVYRSGGLGGPSRPTVIGVAAFEHIVDGGGRIVAYRGVGPTGETEVEFPAGTQYLYIKGALVNAMTAIEAAQKQKEEEEEVDRVFGKDPKSELGGIFRASEGDENKGYL